MELKIKSFGKIATITGSELVINDVTDTTSLRNQLGEKYPELKALSYLIAVNKDIVRENKILEAGSEVALLPPFSGG